MVQLRRSMVRSQLASQQLATQNAAHRQESTPKQNQALRLRNAAGSSAGAQNAEGLRRDRLFAITFARLRRTSLGLASHSVVFAPVHWVSFHGRSIFEVQPIGSIAQGRAVEAGCLRANVVVV